jgi:hypothetical protein
VRAPVTTTTTTTTSTSLREAHAAKNPPGESAREKAPEETDLGEFTLPPP